MVQSIQVYYYENVPSIGLARKKVQENPVVERNVSGIHYINRNNLQTLKTKFRDIKAYCNGYTGNAYFQYIDRERPPSNDSIFYTNFSINYDFYINKDLGILIIGGASPQRNPFKSELAQFFSDERTDITDIIIDKNDLFSLIKKINSFGPIKNGIPRNMMSATKLHYDDFDSHGGAEIEAVKMHDDAEPICVSKHELFKRNFPKCRTFDAKMRIFRCNGILNDLSEKEYKLLLKAKAEFSTAINPTFTNWILFVTNVCKTALRLN